MIRSSWSVPAVPNHGAESLRVAVGVQRYRPFMYKMCFCVSNGMINPTLQDSERCWVGPSQLPAGLGEAVPALA